MEISAILSKTKHSLPDFLKQEDPFEFSPNLTNRTNKPNAIPLKSLPESLSKRDPKALLSVSLPANSNSTVQNPPRKITDGYLRRLRKTGHLEEAVTVLDSIAQHGGKVRPKTFVSLLQSCIDSDSIDVGRKLHACIDSVCDSNPLVETKLVSMYAKCGSLEDARRVFDEMRERNLFVWSAMISACSREQRWKEIVKLFAWMMVEGSVMPDKFLLPKILQACANSGNDQMGELTHSIAIRSRLDSSVHVKNSILAMYAKCGKLQAAKRVFEKMSQKDLVTWNSMISGTCQSGETEEAMKLFDRMQAKGIQPGVITWNVLIASYNQSGDCECAMELMKKMESSGITPDVFTWTSMISGFAQNNRTLQALDLFREMWLTGVKPTGVTVASAVSACTSLKAFKKGTEIQSVAIKMGLANGLLVGNSLIDLYAKCEKLEDAQRLFNMISERDIFTWNSMIGGYVQAGYCGKAHDLFEKMQSLGLQRNVITWNVMISGYMQNGHEDQAMELFNRMERDGIKRNTASWNSLIAGSLQHGHRNKALRMFRQMQSCMKPNAITILSILPACANLIAASKVKEIHACVLRSGLDCDVPILNILIDTYAKSGDIVRAQFVFDSLSCKDLISWNSLLSGYILHGRSEAAIDLLDQMKHVGIRPNHATFLNMILAYSLAGMVNEGMEVFTSMTLDYQISPGLEHYAAVVDLLGRSRKLREAIDFIEKMPVKSDISVWAALLTACRIYGSISLATHAAEQLIKLEPGNLVMHRLLLQLYALGGRPDDLSRVRKPKKQNETMDSLGCCWVEAKNTVHTFFSGDRSLPNADAIYAQLDKIGEEIKKAESGFHDMQLCIEEEEETVGIHSEKLAISFALIGKPDVQSIRIIKNLRICTACHNAAKLISSFHGLEIFLKDPKRLHHFKKGQCSCKDYW